MRYLRISQAFMACLAACLLYSCTSREELTQYVSNDYTVIASANLENVLQNAGCTVDKSNGIELAAPIKNVINSALSFRTAREVNDVLAIKGVDLSEVLYAVTPEPYQLCIFRITNLKSFQNYLEELNNGEVPVTEEKGYTVYHTDKQSAIFISNNIGFVLSAKGGHANVETLEELIAKAERNPLQQWQLDALKEGNALNACINIGRVAELAKAYANIDILQMPQTAINYDSAKYKKSISKVNVWLDGLEMRAGVQLLDSIGQPLENKLAGVEVDTSLMKYAGANDYLIAMAALPASLNVDSIYKATVDQMDALVPGESEVLNNVMHHLSNLDGTAMLAVGPLANGNVLSLEGWHIVLAAQLKEGMAQDYIKQIKELVDVTNQSMTQMASQYASFGMSYKPKNIKCEETDSTLVISLPQGGTVYAQAIGKELVLSTTPISANGGCNISPALFQGMNSGLVIQLPRINPLSKFVTFPFGIDIESFSDQKDWTISATETDTEGLFLENIFKALGGNNK